MPTPTEIKFFRTLRDKKAREESGLFVAETPKVVSDMLAGGLRPEKLYVVHEALGKWQKQFPDLPLESVSSSALERLSFLKQAHEISAVFNMPQKKSFEQQKITLVLDDISDPGNMGTIIRTAHWFGTQNIVCTENCVDVYNPKVVQSTMGSLCKVNVFAMNPTNIAALLSEKTQILGAYMDGENFSTVVFEFPLAIIIGSEANGIQNLANMVQQKVSIFPANIADSPESLNASVATAIILNRLSN